MEHQLWKQIVEILKQLGKPRFDPKETYSDLLIVMIWFWAVVHDRPVCWACSRKNWPPHAQRRREWPSNTTMSRRLRSEPVKQLLLRLEEVLLRPEHQELFFMLDGKPLTIGGCSKDRQAGYGRAAGCKAKGYKIHVIAGSHGSIAAWRLAPMNKDERVMAQRLLATANIQGYVATDSNYDSNKLHAVCDQRGNLQMVTPRRYGRGRGLGHRKQTCGRLRSKQLLENPRPAFGQQLIRDRDAIERQFGELTSWGGGLTHLPPWVRTHRRVHRWVQAKLILNAVKHRTPSTSYVN